MAGPDLKAVHGVQTAIQASSLGPALVPSYSFYSITEVSEYVPDAEEYGRILREREGLDPESSIYQAKVKAYAERLGPMNRQRLYPEFPGWPCLCFYPMSKMRTADQNWYMLPFEARSELMSYHARSGMKFAGKVSQLITAFDGPGQLGMGRDPLGPQPDLSQGHRLHDAVRRELGQVRALRRLLFWLHPPARRAAGRDPDLNDENHHAGGKSMTMPVSKKKKKSSSWMEKLDRDEGFPKVVPIGPSMTSQWGEGTMVIPAPREVNAIMKRVPAGKLITINEIRSVLARRHGATMGCPMTTGIFAWIAANAAEEDAGTRKASTMHALLADAQDGGIPQREVPRRRPGPEGQARGRRPSGRGAAGKRYVVEDYESVLAVDEAED